MKNPLWLPVAVLVLPLAVVFGLLSCSKPTAEAGVNGASNKPTDRSGPPPQIACDAPVHAFGSIIQGADAVHTFVIKNKGQGMLKIERAQGS